MSAIAPPIASAGLSEAKKGIIYCINAHILWGMMAYYFKLIDAVSPVEIAVHRGLWSFFIALALIWLLRQFDDVRRALARPRILITLTLTSFLIAFNWCFYIWAIQHGRTIEASLGYYINPLLNVVAGAIFLGERFTRTQLVAIGIAVIAVLVQTLALGVVPWLGLMLGATFCIYGLIRKTVDVGPTQGFFIEVLILLLPALAAAVWLDHTANNGEPVVTVNGEPLQGAQVGHRILLPASLVPGRDSRVRGSRLGRHSTRNRLPCGPSRLTLGSGPLLRLLTGHRLLERLDLVLTLGAADLHDLNKFPSGVNRNRCGR